MVKCSTTPSINRGGIVSKRHPRDQDLCGARQAIAALAHADVQHQLLHPDLTHGVPRQQTVWGPSHEVHKEISMCFFLLVGGWATYPSEKWWSSEMLGSWHSQYMEKWKSCSKPPTSLGQEFSERKEFDWNFTKKQADFWGFQQNWKSRGTQMRGLNRNKIYTSIYKYDVKQEMVRFFNGKNLYRWGFCWGRVEQWSRESHSEKELQWYHGWSKRKSWSFHRISNHGLTPISNPWAMGFSSHCSSETQIPSGKLT